MRWRVGGRSGWPYVWNQATKAPSVSVVVAWIFFFQAEDGIRDYKVTGVQTCALPISSSARNARAARRASLRATRVNFHFPVGSCLNESRAAEPAPPSPCGGSMDTSQIGRAACRGRGENSVVAGSFKKKKRKILQNSRV